MENVAALALWTKLIGFSVQKDAKADRYGSFKTAMEMANRNIFKGYSYSQPTPLYHWYVLPFKLLQYQIWRLSNPGTSLLSHNQDVKFGMNIQDYVTYYIDSARPWIYSLLTLSLKLVRKYIPIN